MLIKRAHSTDVNVDNKMPNVLFNFTLRAVILVFMEMNNLGRP